MTKTLQDAYIVAATRSAIGRASRGALRHKRPDELLADVIRAAVRQTPALDVSTIEDAIIGCARPEGPQGLNAVSYTHLTLPTN